MTESTTPQDRDATKWCDDCGYALTNCGEPDSDGEPSLDCKVCQLRGNVDDLRTRLAQTEAQRIRLHANLIDLLHRYGTGETDDHDGENIDEMVTRIAAERDRAEAQLEAVTKERDAAEECLVAFMKAYEERDALRAALLTMQEDLSTLHAGASLQVEESLREGVVSAVERMLAKLAPLLTPIGGVGEPRPQTSSPAGT